MANYSSAFSPSFKANTFVKAGFSSPQLVATKNISLSNINFNALKNVEFNPVAFTPGLNLASGWTFITAPENVSWDIANQANRIDMFGTNNPPVVAGSRGMRDLNLGNALVEGFVRGVTIEGKVAALEKLMNYGLNASDGFVSAPVYQVWANNKSYGGSEAYYIIRDVKVKEAMRDLKGNATRAYVDISLMQVPAYQVNSGRDQASLVTSGVRSGLLSSAQVRAARAASSPAAAAANAQVDGNKNAAATQSPAGPSAPSSNPPKPLDTVEKIPPNRRIPLF